LAISNGRLDEAVALEVASRRFSILPYGPFVEVQKGPNQILIFNFIDYYHHYLWLFCRL